MPEDLATDLLEAMADLKAALEDLSRRVIRSRVISFGLVVVLALTLWEGWELRHETACSRGWAVAYTSWQEARLAPARARTDAIDQILRTFNAPTDAARRHGFDETYRNYLTVSDRYAAIDKANPLPPEPQYTC